MQAHPTLARAGLGGLAGTTAMMYLVAPMMGLNMDITAMLGTMLGGSWAAGMMRSQRAPSCPACEPIGHADLYVEGLRHETCASCDVAVRIAAKTLAGSRP